MFPIDKVINTKVERRRWASRIENCSFKISKNERENWSITISVLKANHDRSYRTSMKSAKYSSKKSSSDDDNSKNSKNIALNAYKWSTKAIKFDGIKVSSSSDKISNITWSSTSSKVSVNSEFMKIIRFSRKSKSIYY